MLSVHLLLLSLVCEAEQQHNSHKQGGGTLIVYDVHGVVRHPLHLPNCITDTVLGHEEVVDVHCVRLLDGLHPLDPVVELLQAFY